MDPNILEVIQCQPILQQVMIRVAELQKEWPDHPTLKQVCKTVLIVSHGDYRDCGTNGDLRLWDKTWRGCGTS